MQSCPICDATPLTFNTLSNKNKDIFLSDPKSLQYGLSPLHAWIRIFETCLRISYRIDIKVWQVRGDENEQKFAQKKKKVQKILWEKLGLIVDKPKQGGGCGNTNDGNTARRALQNPKLLARCLDLDSELLHKFKTILVALSCHFPIDPKKFQDLCNETAELYVERYSWYPMPSTLHKILIHGADVISTSILPVGMLAEEASESRNKDYKNFRTFHSRKRSRLENMEDLFNRVMDSSDPMISSMSLESKYRKKNMFCFDKDVRDLFMNPQDSGESSSNIENDDRVGNENEEASDISQTFAILDGIELIDSEGEADS